MCRPFIYTENLLAIKIYRLCLPAPQRFAVLDFFITYAP